MQGTGLPGPGTLCISNVRQLMIAAVMQLMTKNKEQIALFVNYFCKKKQDDKLVKRLNGAKIVSSQASILPSK